MKTCSVQILVFLMLIVALARAALGEQRLPVNAIVLATAREYRDGGGFCWGEGAGTPEEIRFQGSRILSKGKGGTYCATTPSISRACGGIQERRVRGGPLISQPLSDAVKLSLAGAAGIPVPLRHG